MSIKIKLIDLLDRHYLKIVCVTFWLVGVSSNFGFITILSAAHDFLSPVAENMTYTNTSSGKYDCNSIGTGAVLLVGSLPGMTVRTVMPFFMHKTTYPVRIGIIALLNSWSLLIVALSYASTKWLELVGIALGSVCQGLGEITFLSLSTTYDEVHGLSGWSSGTGMSALGATLLYAGLTSIGLTPANAILITLFMPILILVSYAILPKPKQSPKESPRVYTIQGSRSNNESMHVSTIETTKFTNETITLRKQTEVTQPIGHQNTIVKTTICHKTKNTIQLYLRLIRPLHKYMIPFFLVYFFQFFINQGFFELLYFKNAFLGHKNQYRWYNVCFQLGTFISKSSISLIKIRKLYILSVLQFINTAILLAQIFYGFAPIWLVFLIIFWEGILGGLCYVNVFYLVSVEIPKEDREFSIAFTSASDAIGMSLAALLAIPIHDAICIYGKST
jgi:battenin